MLIGRCEPQQGEFNRRRGDQQYNPGDGKSFIEETPLRVSVRPGNATTKFVDSSRTPRLTMLLLCFCFAELAIQAQRRPHERNPGQ